MQERTCTELHVDGTAKLTRKADDKRTRERERGACVNGNDRAGEQRWWELREGRRGEQGPGVKRTQCCAQVNAT
jgi:hypothetical protein